MKMKMFMVAALAWVSLGAMAQKTMQVVDRVEPRTVQEFDHQETTQSFRSHWFLNLQGGAQYTLGEAKFSKLLSPNVQAAIGYQFSPVFAMRLQANGWQSKGAWDGHRTAIGNEPFTADYKFKYVAPGLDFMFSLSNLIGGWNPDRLLDVTAFIGGGANIAWGNDEVNDIAAVVKRLDDYNLEYLWDGTKVRPFGRAGLQLGFRLSDAVQLMLEGNANITSDKYNSKKAENADWYFNALAGLRINLGKVRNVETHDIYRDVVVYDTIYKTVVIEDPVIEPIRRDIFFLRNKTDIRPEEAGKLKDIADYLQKYPKAKVDIVGYADVQTGNAKINARLAAARADVVVKALIEEYGISADRITYDSKGDTVQPFVENDLNRVSICIAEVKQ
jgi:outer membrane protein OmpA-like peptidoglycan-associated protein